MGQEYGKTCRQWQQNYFQQQLAVYRWRSDPSVNTHLPRVTFTSRNKLLNRQKLQNFMHNQLTTNKYVDIGQLWNFKQNKSEKDMDEVMTFESFFTTLTLLQQMLSFDQSLFVLISMLNGYQNIYKKMGKVYIDSECCFITQKGEVRCWINSNPVINQFPQNVTCQVTEGSSVNSIIRLVAGLNYDKKVYQHLQNSIALFLERDLLHHLSFTAVRRFINGYIYAHRISLPLDIRNVVNKIRGRIRPSSFHSSHSSNYSHLHQQRQRQNSTTHERISSNSSISSKLSNSGYESRQNLSQSSISGASNAVSEQLEFYRPDQNYQRKLSTLDLNASLLTPTNKDHKRSLNRSQIIFKKSSNTQNSTANTNYFSKKNKVNFMNASSITPKHQIDISKSKMEEGTKESFTATGGHSKHPSDITTSKMVHSNSAINLINSRCQPRKNVKHQRVVFFQEEQTGKINSGTQQSRQPSFDENSSSLFVTPSNQTSSYELRVHEVNKKPKLPKMQAVSEFDQSQQDSSFLGPNLSTRGQISPSLFLNRQVSNLVQNQELKMFESRGSFLSFQESSANASEYKGALLGLCHSANIISTGTSKRISNNQRDAI